MRVRAGDNRREVKLAIAKLAETRPGGRATRASARSDPRSDAFATVLGQQQIDELPDDPDEMEQALQGHGRPGRGACASTDSAAAGCRRRIRLQQIRFRRNMFAADAHEPGFVSVDIITKPGLDNWRGSTTSASATTR